MSSDLSDFSLIELFRLEAEGQLAALNSGLLALESESDPATIEPMMRAAHSLKGAARIVGMTEAERVAHVLEDIFVATQTGRVRLDPEQIDTLLKGVDLIGEIAALDDSGLPAWSRENAERVDGAIARITAIERGPAAALKTEDDTETTPDQSAKKVAGRRVRPRSKRVKPSDQAEPVEPPLGPVGIEPIDAVSAPHSRPPAAVEFQPVPIEPATGPSIETSDRVVRVSAENLNRLMGLAGESLVEARRLRPIVDGIGELRAGLGELWQDLVRLDDATQRGRDTNPDEIAAHAAEARRDVRRSLDDLAERMDRLESHARRGEDLAERLHFEVISSRLRPLTDGTRGFPRLVRDVARQLGKQVRFDIEGGATGVDRDILDKLEAPITHLIRNALDHAIEPPEERAAAGKAAQALIRLEARHVAGMLQIVLTDDGRGIDVERIRAKVVERGHANTTMAAQLTDAELLEFLFLPGFSTKHEVTDLSGRGVGLDVVQSVAQAVGGSVRVTTRLGRGTSFALLLPITLSVIRALLVRIGGEPYAFPLGRIDRILKVRREEVEVIEGRRFFRLDDRAIGLVSAAQVFDRATAAALEGVLPVVVVSDRSQVFGVVVDSVLGELDLDVRPLDPRLGKVPNINSVSILEDGWPVLIIDVEDLVRSVDNLLGGRRALSLAEAAAASSRVKRNRRVLVVDDSITVRELERHLLEARGYEVEVAVDGLDGWNTVRGGRYDLVVSDVDMPRMDGIQLVTQIKQDARLRSIPVVIVSYKDRAEDRLRGLEAGADAYLTKGSFHDETFLTTVEDLIGAASE